MKGLFKPNSPFDFRLSIEFNTLFTEGLFRAGIQWRSRYLLVYKIHHISRKL